MHQDPRKRAIRAADPDRCVIILAILGLGTRTREVRERIVIKQSNAAQKSKNQIPDCENGALFDGVPRTIGQAQQLSQMGINFTHVIEIFVEDKEIVNRMSGRRVHPGSGRNYHVLYNPPQTEGADDITGEPLVQREDDKPETVLKRLEVYHDQTKPLTDFYRSLFQNTMRMVMIRMI